MSGNTFNQHSLESEEVSVTTSSDLEIMSAVYSVMTSSWLRNLVGSLFTAITNAIKLRLDTTVNMSRELDINPTLLGSVDQVIMQTLHSILDASSILECHTDVGDYLAGVIKDAIIGGE